MGNFADGDDDEFFDDEDDGGDDLSDFDDEDEFEDDYPTSSGRSHGGHGHHSHYSSISMAGDCNVSGNGYSGQGSSSDLSRHRSISESSQHGLEQEDNRRDHHNQLERKRRASIKGSYNELRDAIPDLRGSKASRVTILQHAVELIESITKENQDYTECVETLAPSPFIYYSKSPHIFQCQELERALQRSEQEESLAEQQAALLAVSSHPTATLAGNGSSFITGSSASGSIVSTAASGLCSFRVLHQQPQSSIPHSQGQIILHHAHQPQLHQLSHSAPGHHSLGSQVRKAMLV
ncbi:unnamed protein product [Protopolystoma xenopodis]|uniref:BHLH domain-containing protein n=1 Tax=Protopolystoma xenopodis TaxID=117903 RepID=A0A3S4ZFI8_9PLAT|nr:unnamed protein product [Protopolystoma xenopodis]